MSYTDPEPDEPEDPARRDAIGFALALPFFGVLGELALRALRRPAAREGTKIGGRWLLEPDRERRIPFEAATAANDRQDRERR